MDGRKLLMERHEYQTGMIRQVHLLARQWEYHLNQQLREVGLTFPQIGLLSTIEQETGQPPTVGRPPTVGQPPAGGKPPTVGHAADLLLMSHQNVMRLAKPLEKKGFLEIRKDLHDRRVLRLFLTEKHYEFWERYQQRSRSELEILFAGIENTELEALHIGLGALLERAMDLRQHPLIS